MPPSRLALALLACVHVAKVHAIVEQQQQTVVQGGEPLIPYINITRDPGDSGGVLPGSFVSYSIEFSSFPDFAGNLSHPNTFSNTLLENLGKIQGARPIIRVGGNTQYV